MVEGAPLEFVSLAAASAAAIALAKQLSPTRGDKGGMAGSLECGGDSRSGIAGLVGDSLVLFMIWILESVWYCVDTARTISDS